MTTETRQPCRATVRIGCPDSPATLACHQPAPHPGLNHYDAAERIYWQRTGTPGMERRSDATVDLAAYQDDPEYRAMIDARIAAGPGTDRGDIPETTIAAAQPGSTPDVRRQHLTLDEQRFLEPIWTCAACGSGLVNGLVAHHDNCRWLAAIRDQATTTERERILASMRLPTVPAPETATTAMTRAIQAYEPEATGAVIASPKQLLSVLLEAARRATEAAAPHIDAAARASERETIRRELHDAIRELSQPCPAPEGPR